MPSDSQCELPQLLYVTKIDRLIIPYSNFLAGHLGVMQIRLLTINRYRGIQSFTWKPRSGVNCLIGPGDSFKSTVLAAISLLLAPYPLGACSEFDYYRRRISDGFEIEAYIGNLDLQALATEHRFPHFYGWQDDNPVPLPEGPAESVLRCRVRGTADLELLYDLPLDSDEEPPSFSAGLRRKLMLARLASEDRAARDLRLGTGSLLDRHLKTSDMRAPVHGAIASATAGMEIPEPAHLALSEIRNTFQSVGLPIDLHLGLVPTQGAALVGMVALASGPTAPEAIPIANAGTGTRQMALLHLSAALAGSAPILIIDEPERGLEPYRQRSIAKKIVELSGTTGQAFMTTHAPAILQTLPPGSVWRMRQGQPPLPFDGESLIRLFQLDPDAFFALVPILCEGATEIGLLDELLPAMLLRDLDGCGVRFVDGMGQPNVLDIADAFVAAGITCGVFLDNENVHRGRRANIQARCTTLVWDGATNIEDAVCKWLPHPGLFALIPDAAQATEIATRYLEDHVHERIPAAERLGGPRDLVTAHYPEHIIRNAFCAAMLDRGWFKSREGGRILARALNRIGMPPEIGRHFDDFGARLRTIVQ